MAIMKAKKSQNQGQSPKGNRFLISVTVLGSAGPIRFIVHEEELVANVINTALKSYEREGRLPVLGTDLKDFMLYCPVDGTEALLPWDTIGSVGVRNFILSKRPETEKTSVMDEKASSPTSQKRGAGSFKAWLYGSRSHKISSH